MYKKKAVCLSFGEFFEVICRVEQIGGIRALAKCEINKPQNRAEQGGVW